MSNKKETTKQDQNADSKDSYHNRVTQELKQQGKTQQWLASQLGKHRQYIRQILKTNKRSKYTDEIAELLEVNPGWLETGKGTKFLYKKVKSNSIRLYSYNDLKQHHAFSNIKPIQAINVLDPNIDFAILNDTPNTPYPEQAILFFENKTYEDLSKDNLKKPTILASNHLKNEILLYELTETSKTKAILLKPIEKNNKTPSEPSETTLLGLLKEIRIKFY